MTEAHIYIAGGKTVHVLTMAGEEIWRRELAGEIAAGITVDEDRLFVHSSAGLHALADTGEENWFYESADLGPLVDGRTWRWGNEILADPWGWYRSALWVQDDAVASGTSGGVLAVSTPGPERSAGGFKGTCRPAKGWTESATRAFT